MTGLLDAIAAERERVNADYDATIGKLDELEQLARELNGGGFTDVPAPPAEERPAPPPVPKKPPVQRASSGDFEQRVNDVRELFSREGAMIISEVADRTGWNSSNARRLVEAAAKRGLIRPTGVERRKEGVTGARLATEYEVADASPEFDAGTAKSETLAEELASAVPAIDEDLDVEPAQPDVVVETDDYIDPPRKTFKHDNALVTRMLEFCELEAKAPADIVEALGITHGRVMTILMESGRFEPYGARRHPTQAREVQLWRPVPLPHERPDVTIRHADRAGSVEQRAKAVLEEHGRLSVEQLAARLVLHPRIVADAVKTLIEDGDVEKLPGGVYATKQWAAA